MVDNEIVSVDRDRLACIADVTRDRVVKNGMMNMTGRWKPQHHLLATREPMGSVLHVRTRLLNRT